MKVKIKDLQIKIKTTLTSTYYSDSQAEEIAEVLLYAEMTGKNTQGLIKLLGTEPIQSIKPLYKPKNTKETKLSALIDGGGNPGILVSKMATGEVIKKCKDNGLAIIGTNNTYSSAGVIGYYASEMAKNDFIGIVMAGSTPAVAPHGSIEAMFGTNPIAFGFPTEDEPLVFDMATSAITWYRLVRAKTLGEEIPEGVAIDSEGRPTTNPAKAMEGAILPFDKNYKGSGLNMIIEILTGPLVGADSSDNIGKGWGNLFIAIDPEALAGIKEFKKNCSTIIDKVRRSKKSKDFKEIRIPGEKGLKLKKQAEQSGEIEIDPKLMSDLDNLVRN